MEKVPHNEYYSEVIPQPQFKGYWIPKELGELGLSATEQFLLSMIDSLEQEAPVYCFASNKYLADKMALSESRISFYITKFKRMGLIRDAGYDGRRRKLATVKQNWYMPKNDDFKTKHYARKREVRLRENANHITKSSYEDKKESIPPKPPIPQKPPPDPSPPNSPDSLLGQPANFLANFDSPEVLSLLSRENEYTAFFRPKIVARWVSRFGATMVSKTIDLFFLAQKNAKLPINKPEAWMETALKNRFVARNQVSDTNKAFAIDIKDRCKARHLKINKRYCVNTINNKEYYYDMSQQEFEKCILAIIDEGPHEANHFYNSDTDD